MKKAKVVHKHCLARQSNSHSVGVTGEAYCSGKVHHRQVPNGENWMSETLSHPSPSSGHTQPIIRLALTT
jgi:hypothetical protein